MRQAALKSPLALCDYQSVNADDMIATDRVLLDQPELPPGETYSIAYSEAHQWYYHKDLPTDHVILIKCFDFKDDVGKEFPANEGHNWTD